MADISQIKLPNSSVYDLKDSISRGLLNGHSVGVDVPSDAMFTDTLYTLTMIIDTNDTKKLNIIFSPISEGSGTQGGGTLNYNELLNKPSIENIELSGNKTFANLGATALTAEEIAALLV